MRSKGEAVRFGLGAGDIVVAVNGASVAAGTTIHVHVSIAGYGNFSDDFVEVTYYNDVTLGNDRNTQTMVSAMWMGANQMI